MTNNSMNKKYTTILFDLDGTLLNTLDDLMNAVNHALSKNGFPQRNYEEIRAFVGNGIRKLVERATPDGENNPCFEKIFEDFKKYYAIHNNDITDLYPGIDNLLNALHDAGIQMAIVTNKNQANSDDLKEQYFKKYLDVVVGDDGIRKRKPDREPIDEALRRLGIDPEDEDARKSVLYIGDSGVDAATAENSNLDYLLCSWGFRDIDELMTYNSKKIVSNCSEILDFMGLL